MGRTPKPTNLKLLHGDDKVHPERINKNEPIPTPGEITPPRELQPESKVVWDRLAPDLIAKGVLTPWDTEAFAVFCDAIATYAECKELLAEQGFTARGAAGGVIKNPHWQIMRDAVDIISRIGGRFGMTPADRAHLNIGSTKQDDDGAWLLAQ